MRAAWAGAALRDLRLPGRRLGGGFFWWYRDDPRDNPRLNAAERELVRDSAALASGHGDVPWAKMLRSRQVWMLCWQYFFLSYGWWFYITWLPTYLVEGRHLTMRFSEWLAVLPLFFGGLGNPASRCRWAHHALDRQRDAVAAHYGLRRVHRGVRVSALLHHRARPFVRHVGHGHGQFFERPRDARPGGGHGRGRQIPARCPRHEQLGQPGGGCTVVMATSCTGATATGTWRCTCRPPLLVGVVCWLLLDQ